MAVDQSIIGYFLHAGWVVKVVMLMLVAISIISWTLIFQRRQTFNLAKTEQNEFEERFWSGQSLNYLYSEVEKDPQSQKGLACIFSVGFKEYLKLREHPNLSHQELMQGLSQVMGIAKQKELDALSEHLNFLATAGSVTPYIGLFGTVWGIMAALTALGNVQTATIAMVAPGISEALVATALGLFVAIPAAIAYNRFSARIDKVASAYDAFESEFLAFIRRNHGMQEGAQ